MMGRVEVTLRIDALLPLTEAGQCLLSMVNDFQSLLEKEEEEMGTAEFPVLKAHYASPRKQPRGTSSAWAPQTSTGRSLAEANLLPALNTITLMTFIKRPWRTEVQDRNYHWKR